MRWNRAGVQAVAIALGAILTFGIVAGCATVNVKPMSTTGIATVTLKTYYAEAKHTETMSQRTDLTEAQKDIVRKKKAIIVKVDPMIKAYGRLVAAGGVPTDDQVAAINNLIDDLVIAGSK